MYENNQDHVMKYGTEQARFSHGCVSCRSLPAASYQSCKPNTSFEIVGHTISKEDMGQQAELRKKAFLA